MDKNCLTLPFWTLAIICAVRISFRLGAKLLMLSINGLLNGLELVKQGLVAVLGLVNFLLKSWLLVCQLAEFTNCGL